MNPEELYKKYDIKFKQAEGGYDKTHRKSVEKENGELLYYLVKIHRPMKIIETGSGFSTMLMANALKENGKGVIHTFDTDKNWQGDVDNKIKNIECHMHVSFINSALNKAHLSMIGKINFVFLDADHTYDSVIGEFNIVKEYLEKNSIIAFHDSSHPKFLDKVGRAITDICKQNNITERFEFKTAFGLTLIKYNG